MTPTKRPWRARTDRVKHDGDRENDVVDAAIDVFSTQGYSDTTVADIAQAAGLSRSGFYVYFASKSEVMRAVAVRARDDLIAAQVIGDADGLSNREVLRRTMLQYLDVSARYSRLLGVMEQRALSDPALVPLLHERQVRAIARTRRFIERASLEEPFPLAASPHMVAEALTGLVERCARMINQNPADRERIERETVALGFRLVGFAPD